MSNRKCDRNCGGTNHIASKYDLPIFAFVDCDSAIVVRKNVAISGAFKGINVSGSGSASSSERAEIVHIANRYGFTPINARSFLPFKPGHAETKYISIFDVNGRNIAGCFTVGCNESVLIDAEGYPRKSVHNDIWREQM
uniref:Uncharacterized protein n=1 Tax=Panagrolaimus sp. ES5 TaxID=591445 RepID=A0AC34G2U8_9BILA